MCGIAGTLGLADEALVRRMCAAMKHRGPDDEGTFVDRQAEVALGMVRLSIIDLAGGHQPMASADGRLHLVFNGEIYNFRQLREELSRQGVTWQTRSDTEVILALYEREGRACVKRLRGMFAFALWDGRRQELVLARDRLGVKPLYYVRCGDQWAFASELKALRQWPALPARIDPIAAIQYLMYLYVPSPRSILEGVSKLPAGTVAVIANGRISIEPYWDIAEVVARPVEMVPSLDTVRDAIQEAVTLRLVSDVPLGVFLSGGLDSSAVVAAMRKSGADPIRTFALGFEAPYEGFNELPAARLVAQHLGTEHHELIVKPDVAALLPTIVRHLDEPCADSSALLTYLVSRETRRHVTVALSGIGGDELFAGYPRYLGVKLSAGYAALPLGIRQALSGAAGWLPESTGSRNPGGRMKRFLQAGVRPWPGRYLDWIQLFSELQLHALLANWGGRVQEAAHTSPHARLFERCAGLDPLRQVLAVDTATYLSDNLLMFGDRMSMAHSLELREPLCDHRLLELAAAVPSNVRLPGVQLKGWMRQAVAPWLPPEILRRKKQGFMLPLGDWLRGPLAPLMQDLLTPARLTRRGWFNPAAVSTMLGEHASGRRLHTHRLWALIMLELWAQEMLDR